MNKGIGNAIRKLVSDQLPFNIFRTITTEVIMRICEVEGCERKSYSKGYCQRHYTKNWKYGNPTSGKFQERHGLHNIPEYKVWKNLKQRCCNPKNGRYHTYGGRGIIVCDRWRNSFISFYKDMGDKPFPKAQIDRIDNDGNYEPDNCEWVKNSDNAKHTTATVLNWFTVRSIRRLYAMNKYTHRDLCKMYNLNRHTLQNVIYNIHWREG